MAYATDKAALTYPKLVQIFYKTVDGCHRFTSPEMPGLLVFHEDMETAFNMLASTISDLVSLRAGVSVSYVLDIDYDAFVEALNDDDPLEGLFVPLLTAHPVQADPEQTH